VGREVTMMSEGEREREVGEREVGERYRQRGLG